MCSRHRAAQLPDHGARVAERRAAAVSGAGRARPKARVETLPIERASRPDRRDWPMLAGEYFTSIAALAGAAYKMEMNLAGFYQAPPPADPGRQPPAAGGRHRASGRARQPCGQLARLVVRAARQRTGRRRRPRITTRWCGSGRLPRQRPRPSWPRHLAGSASSGSCWPTASTSSRSARSRRAELTLPWPVMRRAVVRIGQALADRGAAGRSGRCLLPDAGRGPRRAGRSQRSSRRRTLPPAAPLARSRRSSCHRCSSAG